MKIIISPAKKMRVDNDTFVPVSKPAFLEKTIKIKEELSKMAEEEEQIEVCCHFCDKKYNFTRYEIIELGK